MCALALVERRAGRRVAIRPIFAVPGENIGILGLTSSRLHEQPHRVPQQHPRIDQTRLFRHCSLAAINRLIHRIRRINRQLKPSSDKTNYNNKLQ